MRELLVEVLDHCEENDSIRAIVTTGRGQHGYCVGQDLNDVVDFDERKARDWIDEWRILYSRIRMLSKPTVAALNGV